MGSQTNRLPDMRPSPQRRFISVQEYPVRPPILSRHFLHDGESPIGRAVIRKNNFNRPFIILPEYAPDSIPDAALLIMPGQDNADGRKFRRVHEEKTRKRKRQPRRGQCPSLFINKASRSYRIPNPGSRVDFYTKELMLRGRFIIKNSPPCGQGA